MSKMHTHRKYKGGFGFDPGGTLWMLAPDLIINRRPGKNPVPCSADALMQREPMWCAASRGAPLGSRPIPLPQVPNNLIFGSLCSLCGTRTCID